MYFLKKFFEDVDKDGKNNADDDHCSYRKIEPEIVSLYADIAGQFAEPVQFIMKEINKHAYSNNHNTCYNYPFTCLRIHHTNFK